MYFQNWSASSPYFQPFVSLKCNLEKRQKPQLPEPERSPSPLPLDNLPQTPAKNEGTPLPSFRRLSGLGSSTKRDSDRPRSGMASLRKALVNVFGGPSKLRRSKIPAFEGPGAAGEESRPVYRNSKQANTVGPVGVPSEWKSTASPSKKRSSLRGKTLRTSRSEFPPHSTPSPINTRPSSNSVNSRARSQRRPALPFMDSSNYAVRTMQANSHRNDEPISPTKMSPTKVGDKHTFLIRRVSVLQEQLQAAQHELMMIEQNGLKPKPHVLANKSSGSDQEDRSSPNKVPPMTDTKAGHTPSNPNLLYPGKENLRSTRSAYTLRPRQSDYEHNNTAPACVSSLPKTFSHCRLRTNGENNDKRNPARQSIQSLFYPNGLSDEEVMRRGSQASATSFTDHRAEGRDREAAYRALSERFEVPHQNTILKHRVSSPVRDAQTEGSLRRNISPVRKVAVNLGNNLPSPNLHNPDRQVSSDPHKSLPEPHSKRPVNRGPSQSFIPIASSVPPGNSTFNLPTLFDTPRQKPQSHQPHVYPPDHPISVVPGRTSTESVPPLPPLPRFEVTRGSYGPTNQTHRFPLHSLLEPGDESFEWPVECL